MKTRDNNTARLMFTLAGVAFVVWLIMAGLQVYLSTYDPYRQIVPSQETNPDQILYMQRYLLYRKAGSIMFAIGILLALVGSH